MDRVSFCSPFRRWSDRKKCLRNDPRKSPAKRVLPTVPLYRLFQTHLPSSVGPRILVPLRCCTTASLPTTSTTSSKTLGTVSLIASNLKICCQTLSITIRCILLPQQEGTRSTCPPPPVSRRKSLQFKNTDAVQVSTQCRRTFTILAESFR